MYINFKSKYKKFFWLLLGFIISCIFIGNVKAIDLSNMEDISTFTLPSGITPENYKIIIRKGYYNGTRYIMTVIPKNNSARFQIYQDSDIFPNAYAIKNLNSNDSSYYASWYEADSSKIFQYKGTNDFAPTFDYKIVYINTDIYSTNGIDKWYDLNYINNLYNVNFHLNGGTVWDMSNLLNMHLIEEDYSIETTSSELAEYLTHITPLKNNYTFNGWYYDSNFTQAYTPGDDLSLHSVNQNNCGNQNGVPCEYTEVEYLESSGTQYIDTGVKPFQTKTEIQFQKTTSIFGGEYIAGAKGTGDMRYIPTYYNGLRRMYGIIDRTGNVWTDLSSFDSNIHTVIYNDENNYVKFDGITKLTISDLPSQNSDSIYLFAFNNNGVASEYFKGKIYYVKIADKNTGNIVRNMIPVVRNSDNTAGMYDIVNNVFYTNSGTGTFLTGSPVSNNNSNQVSEIDLYAKFDLYDYLQGYKKIDLTTNDKYLMISDVTSGSVFIPTQDFEQYGGRLSYYDNDLDIQPYSSYIQDYNKTPDEKFVKQDFDISQFYGADWVMFSKYIYLEGEDNISYSIWVPDTSYNSQVTITPNSSGGNTYDFEYKDTNGDIQDGQVNSVDLSQDNPLLGNIFSDFSSNTFGLTSIITAPLSLIRSLSSTSCTPLNLPLPFVGGTLTLPCMYDFYSNTFGVLFTLYQTITFGVVAYWVLVRIFNMVKDFKNPDHDEIEVVDL